MEKDWTGNEKSVFKMIGSSNHSLEDRETHDYYATSPEAVEKLLQHEKLENLLWEPACGEGHISDCLIKHGHHVDSTDLINRNYGQGGGKLLESDISLSWKHYYQSTLSFCYRIYS